MTTRRRVRRRPAAATVSAVIGSTAGFVGKSQNDVGYLSFLPNEIITTRVAYLARAYGTGAVNTAVKAYLDWPRAAGRGCPHRQPALRPDRPSESVACVAGILCLTLSDSQGPRYPVRTLRRLPLSGCVGLINAYRRRSSNDARQMAAQPDKDIRSQQQGAARDKDDHTPRCRVSDRTEIDQILITPDQMTERVRDEHEP